MYAMVLHIPIQSKFYLDFDLGGYTVDNIEIFYSDKGVKNQNMIQARIVAGYRILEKLTLFIGIGQNYTLVYLC